MMSKEIKDFIKSHEVKIDGIITDYSSFKACLLGSFECYAQYEDKIYWCGESVKKRRCKTV
jgi:hypothetical protein